MFRRPPAPTAREISAFDVAIGYGAVFATLTFNFFLAYVNKNVTPLTTSPVIGAEIVILLAALYVVTKNFHEKLIPLVCLCAFIMFNTLITAFIYGAIEPKYFRDLLIIPVFMMLGMTLPQKYLIKFLVFTQCFVLVFLLLEMFDTEAYVELVHPRLYFIFTRGFSPESWWAEGIVGELWISAARPPNIGRAVAPMLDLHRHSSVFLEPLGLGNYTVMLAIATFAFWSSLGWRVRVFFAASIAFNIIACDGRLAQMMTVLLLAMSLCRAWLPRYANVFLPLAIVPLTALMLRLALGQVEPAESAGGRQEGTGLEGRFPDDFVGRLQFGLYTLARLDMGWIVGDYDFAIADAGWTYLVAVSGIVGAAVWWITIMTAADQKALRARFIVYGITLYLTGTLMVSQSAYSIKSNGLLGMLLGMAVMMRPPGEVAVPSARKLAQRWRQPAAAAGDVGAP